MTSTPPVSPTTAGTTVAPTGTTVTPAETSAPPAEPTAPPTATGGRRGRPAPLRAVVVRVEHPSPRMRRVILGGGELDRFSWAGAASHLKLILPLPGQRAATLPTPDADGTVHFDRSSVVMRTYTPRAWDATTSELTIDIFIHEEGPASIWAAQARAGDEVGVSTPRAHYEPDPDAGWLVLAGDESAVPAIGTILEATTSALPTTVVVESDGDDLELGLPAGAGVRFVARTDTHGQALLEALAEAVPEGDGRVWVAGEARGIRRIRAHLLTERHLPASSIVTRGYWRQGESDHPDHDFGDN